MADAPQPLPRAGRRVAEELARRGHEGRVRVLDDSARSAAEAAAALGVEQRQILKSLVFRAAASGTPVLALVGGTSRVDERLLAAHLGEPVERADAGWVRERTGFAIGGVPPVGHREPLRTVADIGLVALDELWAAAGTPHAVFPLRGIDLAPLTGAELADITGAPAAQACESAGSVAGENRSIRIEEATSTSPELVEAVAGLVAELSSSAEPPDADTVERIVASPACHLLLARHGGRIVGMLTLVVFPIPTGVRAWIEDVVVEEAARGRGAGAELTHAAIALAARLGARTVDLTSRPSREAANRMYLRLGFAQRQTNVYRHEGSAT